MALATQADVGNLLRAVIADDDDLQALLDRASAIVVAWLGWNPEAAAGAVETLEGSHDRLITLQSLKVTAVASVVEDSITLTEGNEDDFVWWADGRVQRLGHNWTSKVQSIVVTYSHGYAADAMPEEIVDVVSSMAAAAYLWGLGIVEITAGAGFAFKSETLPDGYRYQKDDKISIAGALTAMRLGPDQKSALSTHRLRL